MKEIKGEYKGIKKYNFGWYKIESNEQIWLHYKDRKMVICIKRKPFEVLLVRHWFRVWEDEEFTETGWKI